MYDVILNWYLLYNYRLLCAIVCSYILYQPKRPNCRKKFK